AGGSRRSPADCPLPLELLAERAKQRARGRWRGRQVAAVEAAEEDDLRDHLDPDATLAEPEQQVHVLAVRERLVEAADGFEDAAPDHRREERDAVDVAVDRVAREPRRRVDPLLPAEDTADLGMPDQEACLRRQPRRRPEVVG